MTDVLFTTSNSKPRNDKQVFIVQICLGYHILPYASLVFVLLPHNNMVPDYELATYVPVSTTSTLLDVSFHILSKANNISVLSCVTPPHITKIQKRLQTYPKELLFRLLLQLYRYVYHTHASNYIVACFNDYFNYTKQESPILKTRGQSTCTTVNTILDTCSVCMEHFRYPRQLSCRHIFCRSCLQKHTQYSNTCPICRYPMFYDTATRTYTVHDPNFENKPYSDDMFIDSLLYKFVSKPNVGYEKHSKLHMVESLLLEFVAVDVYLYTSDKVLVTILQNKFPDLHICRLFKEHVYFDQNSEQFTIKNIILLEFDDRYPTLLQEHLLGKLCIHAILIYKDSAEWYYMSNPTTSLEKCNNNNTGSTITHCVMGKNFDR